MIGKIQNVQESNCLFTPGFSSENKSHQEYKQNVPHNQQTRQPSDFKHECLEPQSCLCEIIWRRSRDDRFVIITIIIWCHECQGVHDESQGNQDITHRNNRHSLAHH
jgi:hypothetical protein